MPTRPRLDCCPTLFAVTVAFAAITMSPAVGRAEGVAVRGHVNLPAPLRGERRFFGYWRVENGSVPVKTGAATNPPVVVLEKVKGTASGPKTYAVTIAGFAPDKGTLIVAPGSVLEITNNDKVPHDLSIPGRETMMPLERLTAGSMRRQKFPTAGTFEIRCAKYPHLAMTVLVLDHPFASVVDGNGDFKISDVTAGKATLRIYAAGRFVHEQDLDVSAGMRELQITVAAVGAAAAAAGANAGE